MLPELDAIEPSSAFFSELDAIEYAACLLHPRSTTDH
jgi:hypothetical protein